MSDQLEVNHPPAEIDGALPERVTYDPLLSPLWTLRLRWLRRISYVALPLLGLVYASYVWGLKPASEPGEHAQATLLRETAQELVAIAIQLPDANIPIDQTQLRWGLSWARPGTAEVYFDPWDTSDPNSAHALAVVFAHHPDTCAAFVHTRRALDRFNARRTLRETYRDPIDALLPREVNGAELAELTYGLCAAARVALDADQDPDHALVLLEAALPLARLLDQVGSWQAYGNMLENELAPLEELLQVLRHPGISAAAAHQMAAALEDYLSYTEAIDDFAGISGGVETMLDRYYAAESAGGWLVVNHAASLLTSNWNRQYMSTEQLARIKAPYSGFWNLGTLMFDRRQDVFQQIESLRAVAHETATYPTAALYDADHEHYLPLPDTRWAFNSRRNSGLFASVGCWMNRNELKAIRAIVTLRRVVYVVACIAEYRAAQDQLPSSLEALEAELGRSMPLDLSTNQPFMYEPQDDRYDLKSVATIRAIDRSDPRRSGRRSNWRSFLYDRPLHNPKQQKQTP